MKLRQTKTERKEKKGEEHTSSIGKAELAALVLLIAAVRCLRQIPRIVFRGAFGILLAGNAITGVGELVELAHRVVWVGIRRVVLLAINNHRLVPPDQVVAEMRQCSLVAFVG